MCTATVLYSNYDKFAVFVWSYQHSTYHLQYVGRTKDELWKVSNSIRTPTHNLGYTTYTHAKDSGLLDVKQSIKRFLGFPDPKVGDTLLLR